MLTNEQATEEVIAKLAGALGYGRPKPARHRTPRLLAAVGGAGLLATRSGAPARHEPVACAVGRQATPAGRPANFGTPTRSFPPAECGRAAWSSDEARQRCAQLASDSEALLAQIVRQEIESEQEMRKHHDASAERLQAAHAAAMARGAYAAEDRAPLRQLDLSSDR